MYTAQGKMDRTQMVQEYMPLVRRHALSLQVRLPPSVELDDLIQAGMVGLLDALDRYDAGHGASFSTYASQRIRGTMIDELRSRDWLPRSVRRGGRAINKAMHDLEHRLGRAPREREIAAELDMALDEYQQLLHDVNNGLLMAFEDSNTTESRRSEIASAEPDPFEAPEEASFAYADREMLAAAVDNLPEREKLLLGLYYQEELNLKEIGAVLEVSESRVCQLHSQAVARLRVAMADMEEAS